MKTSVPDINTMLGQLIATPSVSSVNPEFDMSNRPLIDLLAGWLSDLGCEIVIQELENSPGKANILGVLGKGSGGLVLSGHTDTVPYDDTGWNSDPFTLTEHDGRLAGLGISDMKSFFAFAVAAAARFKPEDFKKPLIILGTADEESSMAGGRALAQASQLDGRFAIVGEPTGMRPVNRHKGIFMESIRLRGKSGHSSDPKLGRNAIEGMHCVIDALMEFRLEMQKEFRDDEFDVPYPTLNFGLIRGGDNPNRICSSTDLQIDFRTMPGMNLCEIRELLRKRVVAAVDGLGFEVHFHLLFEGVEALEASRESELVRHTEQLTGHAAENVAFSTEGPFLKALGMDTVVLGPGDISEAHQPNESLQGDRIDRYVNVLEGIIHRFCVDPRTA